MDLKQLVVLALQVSVLCMVFGFGLKTTMQDLSYLISRTDTVEGGSDLYPLATLKWNGGNRNWLAYAMGGIPLGAYQVGRLANIGLNHWSLDAGGGYT